MDLFLVGNSAVIVGGARGIGQAIAAGFAREGVRIALIDRDPQVHNTARELTQLHQVQAEGIQADVTHFATLEAAAGQVIEKLGRIDHLIFAAGIGSGKFGFPFWNLHPSDWPRVLEVNLLGAVHTLHAFTPFMRERRDGTVLLVASISGQIGSQTDPPYSASKAALINFGQCAAKDLAPFNVRVNLLNPGMVQTDLNRAVWEAWNRQQPEGQRQTYDDWAGDKIRRVVPLGRWQTPEDMAALAVFLASPLAKNICGQCLNVDGGFVMHW